MAEVRHAVLIPQPLASSLVVPPSLLPCFLARSPSSFVAGSTLTSAVKGGGAYYMISRSLGPAFGGSSGLLFWLTYCINVTFNTAAFTDTVFATWLSCATSL